MAIGIVLFSMIITPYFFHDFKLTIDRVGYMERENRNFSTTEYDEKIVERLGLAIPLNKIDGAYETSKFCTDPPDYYMTGCRIELDVKAYEAYRMVDELDFYSFPRSLGHYAVAMEGIGKLYFVYLDSINWKEYMIVGAFLSITGVLFSVWVYVRYEKHLTNVQNHATGITLGIFVVSIILFLMSQTEMFFAIIFPSPFSLLFVGVPFVTTHASWYYLLGNKLANRQICEARP